MSLPAREAWRVLRRDEHVRLSVLFLASRLFFAAIGLRFSFDLDWMFLSDPVDLRERLFDCVYYFHAYPPGMNLLTGVLLTLGGSHAALLALLTFWALGLLLVNSLFYLLRASALGFRAALVVAFAFSITPPTLFFEHLYLYEHIVAALLAFAGACLHAGVTRASTRGYLAFFTACAAVGWFRSSFHLVWFAGMLALALFFGRGGGFRRVLAAAAAPAILLLALYLKNWALFGVFGATSAAGGNLTHVTLSRLSAEDRARWVEQRRVSPFAALHVYAGPAEYLAYYPPRHDGRSPVLDALERPSFHSPNYNHWLMIPMMKTRREDAAYYLRERPLDYLATVWRGFRQVFGPATEWHPRTGIAGAPHAQHRETLGKYERLYNAVVHFGPGLYVLLPLPCLLAMRRFLRVCRSRVRYRQGQAAVLAFALVQLAYVVATSALFTIGESARYRQQVEPEIWLLTALAVAACVRRFARTVAARAA